MTGLAAAALALAAARAGELPEKRWLAQGADVAAFAAASPGACLIAPDTDEEAYLVEVGRAAFYNPLLFGGAAARAGLSCNACHRDGAGNPAFFLEGLSDRPGRADVTSSLFSRTREDGVFNPVAIPTLVGAAAAPGVTPHRLRAFIESVVVDEFDGRAPPGAVLDGLVAFVLHLDPAACPTAPVPAHPDRDVERAAAALAAAAEARRRDDVGTADAMLLAAQRALADIDARFDQSSAMRRKIRSEATAIGRLRTRLAEPPARFAARVDDARRGLAGLAVALRREIAGSLYDPAALRRRFPPP